MTPADQRKHINKSALVEAALEAALMDHEERGKEGELYYRTMREFLDWGGLVYHKASVP